MADRGPDREAIRNVGDRAPGGGARPSRQGDSQPSDAGKTSGGGSLGHDPVADDQSHIRNEGSERGRGLRDRETPDPLPELEP